MVRLVSSMRKDRKRPDPRTVPGTTFLTKIKRILGSFPSILIDAFTPFLQYFLMESIRSNDAYDCFRLFAGYLNNLLTWHWQGSDFCPFWIRWVLYRARPVPGLFKVLPFEAKYCLINPAKYSLNPTVVLYVCCILLFHSAAHIIPYPTISNYSGSGFDSTPNLGLIISILRLRQDIPKAAFSTMRVDNFYRKA